MSYYNGYFLWTDSDARSARARYRYGAAFGNGVREGRRAWETRDRCGEVYFGGGKVGVLGGTGGEKWEGRGLTWVVGRSTMVGMGCPNFLSSPFLLASVSKTVTGVADMIAVEEFTWPDAATCACADGECASSETR